MKNRTILLALLFLRTTFCSSQGFNFHDYLMPSLDTGFANPGNYISFPPVNQVISTQGNGSVVLGSSFNLIGASTITDLPDIHVSPHGNPQTEPSITINKNHPNNIIISCNYAEQITSGGFLSDQSIYVNNYFNSGTSWTTFRYFPPTGTNPSGDPSTAVDAQGNIYCSTVNKGKNFLMDLSGDLGNNWPMQLDGGTGANTLPGNFDKLMIGVDNLPYSPFVNNCYAAWLDLDGPPYEFVKFSRRVNGGTFNSPVTLSLPGHFGQGTNIKTGPYGEVYVCWADYIFTNYPHLPAWNIGFASDISAGGSLMTTSIPADLSYMGIRNTLGGSTYFNNTKMNDFPVMAVDRSCGPTSSHSRGRIYIAYPENVPSTLLHSRIVAQYSDDHGATWTKCNSSSNLQGTIDIDYANQNWMPWIAVDDASGNVYVAYLSALVPPVIDPADPWHGTYMTDVRLAVSEDGGISFTDLKVSDVPINPIALSPPNFPFVEGYWGDYIAVDAYGGNVYVAWMSNQGSLLGTYNIFCSTVNVTTPVEFTSQLDLPINGPISWSAPPYSPSTILYEAANTITAAVNQEQFSILNGANVTFRAGNSIHILPGTSNANDFGAVSGSQTHLYISDPGTCSTPFRRGNVDGNGSLKNNIFESNLVAYPNPFNSTFELNYSIYSDENVSINLFNVYGQKITEIVNEVFLIKGKYNVQVNLPDLNSGIYYLVMHTGDKNYSTKVVKL